jgi:glycogen(starch) synthase
VVRSAVNSATWVTAVAASVLDSTRELVPAITARSSVIYNGLLTPAIHPAPLKFDPPRLLCLGRLVPEKGFDVALSALPRLVQRFPGLELVIAGDGVERDRLERQAADLNVNTSVKFMGWVAPDKVSQLINTATIVVMPSRWEGLPGVAIQAAQMARPVVGTRVWGLPEVVLDHETGLVVEMDDAKALADAIAHLLEHPEQAIELGSAARQRARDVFGWSRYLDAHDSLYRTLAQEVA